MAEEGRSSASVTRRFQCCSRPFVLIALTWGLLTAASLIAVGIQTIVMKPNVFWIAIYLIASGGLVTLLEVGSLLAFCGICREEGCCRKAAKPILWVENWKRGIIYILLGALCFFSFLRMSYSIICGCMLIISGLLYFGKTCKGRSRRLSGQQVADPDRKQLTEDFIEQQQQFDPNVRVQSASVLGRS